MTYPYERVRAWLGVVSLALVGCYAPVDGGGSREPGGGLDGVARDAVYEPDLLPGI